VSRRHSSIYVRYHHGIINTLKNRFYAKVLLPNESGCMIWTGGKNEKGYGLIHLNKKMNKAHRIAYLIYYGYLPHDMEVMHSCDNPICVCPDHLSLGTHKENMTDAKNKNRTYLIPPRKGRLNNKTVLTEENVKEIRKLLQDGCRKKDLSRKFNVTMENIRCIELRKSWKHI